MDWPWNSLRLADAIARHDFDLREWRVLDFLRRQSFGCGRLRAYVPRLELFARATRITRGNVSTILRRLKGCRVIEEEPQWYYGFLVMPPPADPAANWRVGVRLEEVEVIRQLELLAFPPSVAEGLREAFAGASSGMGKPAGAAGTNMRTWIDSPGHGELTSAHTGVPESGTPANIGGRSRIGNGAREAMFAGVSPPVPESGTVSPLDIGNGTNALKKHWTNGQWGVPESGTGRLTQEELDAMALAGFSGDQQELMELFAEAGALGIDRSSWRCWFDMIQRRFQVCLRLWADARDAKLRGIVFKRDIGAYMMHYWKRWGRPEV